MDSILDTIKKALGIDVDYHFYDSVIVGYINSVLVTLNGLGVGPAEVFSITGSTETWVDFLGEDAPNLESVKTYISSQVRLLFDPLKTTPESENPDSILISVKKLLGLGADDEAFNVDVTMDINSTFMVLNQLGVGPENCFAIASSTETWGDFLGEDLSNLEAVKSYTYLKVKLLFDPPASSFVLDAISRQISELEWRLNVQAEDSLYLNDLDEVVEDEDI